MTVGRVRIGARTHYSSTCAAHTFLAECEMTHCQYSAYPNAGQFEWKKANKRALHRKISATHMVPKEVWICILWLQLTQTFGTALISFIRNWMLTCNIGAIFFVTYNFSPFTSANFTILFPSLVFFPPHTTRHCTRSSTVALLQFRNTRFLCH